jgi:hypothetical protein
MKDMVYEVHSFTLLAVTTVFADSPLSPTMPDQVKTEHGVVLGRFIALCYNEGYFYDLTVLSDTQRGNVVYSMMAKVTRKSKTQPVDGGLRAVRCWFLPYSFSSVQ